MVANGSQSNAGQLSVLGVVQPQTYISLVSDIADTFPLCCPCCVTPPPGKQAEALNYVIGELLQGHPVSDVKLKEVLGHTPLQVRGGDITIRTQSRLQMILSYLVFTLSLQVIRHPCTGYRLSIGEELPSSHQLL